MRPTTDVEFREEVGRRAARQIVEGLPPAQRNEFAAIDDLAEATRWLEENVPRFRRIAKGVEERRLQAALLP